MEYVLKAGNLCKAYPKFKALNNLSMNVPKGAIYGFVGRNGAGKTTLIRLITGLQLPTSGEFEIFGVRHTDSAIHQVRRRMGAVVETPSIYLDKTAEENLRLQYRTLGLPSFDGIKELLELVGLHDTGSKKAKKFSLGMRQRLGIAIALCGNPDFLVLDEPINGLDPQGIIEIRELILKLNRERGVTVLISSHILDELSKLATYYGFVDGGHMLKEMSAQELEAACKKSLYLETDHPELLSLALSEFGCEYRLESENSASIFGSVEITPLVLALHQKGISVKTLTERDESLESFFLSLVGGAVNE